MKDILMARTTKTSLSCFSLLALIPSCTEQVQPPSEQTNRAPLEKKQLLPSGLGYEVLREAAPGAVSPRPGQQVVAHYTGWLDNQGKPGKEFDSSVDRGQPIVFTVGKGHVIAGWDEALLAMKVGEKRRLYIPYQLGYGAGGAKPAIPPYAALIFDVELVGIR